jgi:hypothetical protein
MRVLSFIFITGKAQKLCFVGADVKCDRFTFTMPPRRHVVESGSQVITF